MGVRLLQNELYYQRSHLLQHKYMYSDKVRLFHVC